MAEVDFLSALHGSTKRDYVKRVVDHDKASCATIAKKFDVDYWDGDRCYGYGGYQYDGRWRPIAQKLIDYYQIKSSDRVLDIGCGKGYLLFELAQLLPGLKIRGLDISSYAIAHAKPEVQGFLDVGTAEILPYADQSFDVILSLGCLHNLKIDGLFRAFTEIERVGTSNRKWIMVESWRNEAERANLLYWQLTCESFYDTQSWAWILEKAGYRGDHGFIFFE